MGDEELLTAGVYKVSWKTFTSFRVDTKHMLLAVSIEFNYEEDCT